MSSLFDPPVKCQACRDQGWVQHPQGGMVRCKRCRPETFQPLAQVIDKAAKKGLLPTAELEPREYQVATIILDHNGTRPVKIREITKQTGLDDRAVKAICRTLRDRFLLPIGSSRKEPAGIFWIQTKEEFLSYFHTTRKQAMAELGTLGKMCRKHWPELAGQLSLDLDHEGRRDTDLVHPPGEANS